MMFSDRMTLSALTLMLALGAVAGYAQEGPRGGRGGGPDFLRRLPVMMALDADGDGVISADEINNAAVALRKLDKNNDGKLTEEETRPNFPPGGPGGRREEGPSGPSPDEVVKQLLEFDKNGDGQLSKAELPERMQGLFARGDANKDGVLSKDELRKIAEAQSANAPRGEQHDDHNEGERRPQRPPND
jgi:Ca2+-binding EF-hand superfamily protein